MHTHQCPICKREWNSKDEDCQLPYLETCIDCAWDVIVSERIAISKDYGIPTHFCV
jgi:hypothetical protein